MSNAAGPRALVLNAGSSSLKFALFERESRLLRGQIEGIGTRPRFLIDGAEPRELPASTAHSAAFSGMLGALAERGIAIDRIAACGHRIVHGGSRFVAPMVVDATHLDELNALRALAPLHNRYGLDAIDAMRSAAPALPQIACFDTAFHATMPDTASRFALPDEFHESGFRRFGFHGLNFEHVTAVLGAKSGALPRRLLIFHLGNGCSVAAVRDGRSVGTTMGYSTLDGLVMGTRCGAIDPGLLLALQRDRGMSLEAIEELLYRRSGLLGLSGHSSDMRELERIDDAGCRRAIEHFCYWAARHAASLLVALGGLDAMAFTGGIGVGSASVRNRIVEHLAWLGLKLDTERNRRNEQMIMAADSALPVWVVEANEELAIARHIGTALRAQSA